MTVAAPRDSSSVRLSVDTQTTHISSRRKPCPLHPRTLRTSSGEPVSARRSSEVDALAALDLPAIVDQLLDFSTNPADTPPASLGDPNVADWEKVVDLQKWWLDRMATVPRPLQEKLTLFWHGHFATGQEKVNSARDMYDQNHLFRTEGLGSFENLVQKMSLQVAMLIYLDNEPNQKGSPNENFARELLELFTLGVNQYTQDDVVAAARAWTGHNVDYDVNPRVYRFYGTSPRQRHEDLHGPDPELERAGDHHAGPDGRAAEVDRRALHREEDVGLLRLPEPERRRSSTRSSRRSSHRTSTSRPCCAPSSCTPSSIRSRRAKGSSGAPSNGSSPASRRSGSPPQETNPQWWMDQMGQQLFYPPNVAGWKSNAYWLNSTALWARADFARNLTWGAHEAGFLAEIIERDPATNQHVMSDAAAVDLAYRAFGFDPGTDRVSPYVRGVLVNWLSGQRASEYVHPWSWTHFAQIQLTTMMMITPEVQLA